MLSGNNNADHVLQATAALVVRLRASDPNAVRLLHDQFREPLLRFCWGYLGRMEEAEDAVQEIFCKIIRVGEVPDFFRAWLYKIARNHCLNALRERSSRKDNRGLPGASQLYEALTGNLTRMARDEAQAKVLELVQTLPEAHREVLRLRYVEDLTRAEIAEVLDVPEPVVKSRLFEGLRKLREHAGMLQEP